MTSTFRNLLKLDLCPLDEVLADDEHLFSTSDSAG